jgi:hypothetical protein
LATLFLIGLGVFVRQSRTDMSRFGIDVAGVSGTETTLDLGSLTPAGFKPLSTTEVYDSANLFEKINGKATFYLDCGFRELLTQRFVSESDENIWMELFVYDMSDIANAFSVFSTQKRPEAQMLSFAYPIFHYKAGNGLYFVHGKYYVEVVGSSQSTGLLSAMVDIVQKFSSLFPADDDTRKFEARMAPFPKENIVPGSIKLYLTSAFGFEGLTDTFAAKYRCPDETVTVFLSKRSDAKEARTIAESYCNFLIESGGVEKTLPSAEKPPGRVIDVYGSTEIVFASGPFVAGVHEAESQECALRLAGSLLDSLGEESISVVK